MYIYSDIASGDELFTDIYPITVVEDGFFYRIEGKMTTETTQIDDACFGGNKSAEGGGDDDGADASSKSGINVVLAHEMVATGFDKSSYKVHIKDFMKLMLKKMKENGKSEDDIKAWQKLAGEKVMKFIMKNFKEFDFFIGKSMNEEGIAILVRWEDSTENPGTEVPALYVIKECVLAEKC